MARLADIQAARLAGALLTGDAVKRDAVKGDAPFTLISRRKVRFWIGASATLAAIILVSWKVESHDPQSAGLSLGALSPIQEKDMKFTQALSVAVAAGSICSGVMAQSTAVQWTTASGGNGHWYGVVIHEPISWETARLSAEAKGGYLATPVTAAENLFVSNVVASVPAASNGGWGPRIGGSQSPSGPEPAGGWMWLSNERWQWTNWMPGVGPNDPGEPNDNCPGSEDYLMFFIDSPTVLGNGYRWNDTTDAGDCWGVPHRSFIIEYSADCNSDGIVDYGQILSGQLTDTNSNGIPDICEIDPCPGDINLNSVVDAVDLAMVLTSWGTSGSEYPRADVNHDGIVNGPDLGALLGGWGICP